MISGVFSPQDKSQEEAAAEILKKVFDEEKIPITLTLSNEVSELGLLERENAAILNSSLLTLAKKTTNAFLHSLKQLGLLLPTVQCFLT